MNTTQLSTLTPILKALLQMLQHRSLRHRRGIVFYSGLCFFRFIENLQSPAATPPPAQRLSF